MWQPEVATASYGRLYPLALDEALGEARRQLETADVDVPAWDMALRLARLLNRAFKLKPWPLRPILGLERDSFRALITADSKAGLARRIAAASDEPSPWQAEDLSDVIADRSDREGVKEAILALFSRISPF